VRGERRWGMPGMPRTPLFRFSMGTRSPHCWYSHNSGPAFPSPLVAPVKAPLTRGFCFLVQSPDLCRASEAALPHYTHSFGHRPFRLLETFAGAGDHLLCRIDRARAISSNDRSISSMERATVRAVRGSRSPAMAKGKLGQRCERIRTAPLAALGRGHILTYSGT
jgi:hypothetical protein